MLVVGAGVGSGVYWYLHKPVNTVHEAVKKGVLTHMRIDPATGSMIQYGPGDVTFTYEDKRGDWAYVEFSRTSRGPRNLGWAVLWLKHERKGRTWSVFDAWYGTVTNSNLDPLRGVYANRKAIKEDWQAKEALRAKWREHWREYLKSQGLTEYELAVPDGKSGPVLRPAR